MLQFFILNNQSRALYFNDETRKYIDLRYFNELYDVKNDNNSQFTRIEAR